MARFPENKLIDPLQLTETELCKADMLEPDQPHVPTEQTVGLKFIGAAHKAPHLHP